MPLVGPISASAASSINPTQNDANGTYINFGAGYVDAPNDFTTTPTSSTSAAAGQGAQGAPALQTALTEKDKTVLYVVAGLGGLGIISLTAFFIFHRH